MSTDIGGRSILQDPHCPRGWAAAGEGAAMLAAEEPQSSVY